MRKYENISLKDIKINDSFWSKYISLVKDVVIPYQWEALNDRIPDAAPSHAISNFRIAAGEITGKFGGYVFQDSDIGKWIEAVAYRLESFPDKELEKLVDETVDLLERAQGEDGYLNTYYTIEQPGKRWTNIRMDHELYSAGHLTEGAVAYYEATGKDKFLNIMRKYIDYIDTVFGPEEGKIHAYPGHEEIELALIRLYRVTGEKRYLKLAKYFINERGKQPDYFKMEAERNNELDDYDPEYHQNHLPVRLQDKAVGHAVRAMYLYCGMADVAVETDDEELKAACRRLWDNVTKRQMYITGGVGSMTGGEAFSFDYDLPNDTSYTETCAAIGLVFWARRMLDMDMDSKYADVMERAMYNGTISGMSLDGRRFFYVNPMEAFPMASAKRRDRRHILPTRQKWFGCACCPPNIARMVESIGKYVYSKTKDSIYVHLYMGNEADINLESGMVKIVQETEYPWKENVRIKVMPDKEFEVSLGLRIPGWCENAKIKVNGTEVDNSCVKNGYAIIKRVWKESDVIEVILPMTVERIYANPNVREDAGKVALQRGPIVYCLEEVDNGPVLQDITIPENAVFNVEYKPDMLGGINLITFQGERSCMDPWEDKLYSYKPSKKQKVEVKAIPYYAWANREVGEMIVWMR